MKNSPSRARPPLPAGEVPWVKGIVAKYHEAAAAKKLRIVPCCGFDSTPFDLGALLVRRGGAAAGPPMMPSQPLAWKYVLRFATLLHCSTPPCLQVVDHLKKRYGKQPAKVRGCALAACSAVPAHACPACICLATCLDAWSAHPGVPNGLQVLNAVMGSKGGVSGGTIASGMNAFAEQKTNPEMQGGWGGGVLGEGPRCCPHATSPHTLNSPPERIRAAADASNVYALVPPEGRGTDGEFWGTEFSQVLGSYLAPFVMQVRGGGAGGRGRGRRACGGVQCASDPPWSPSCLMHALRPPLPPPDRPLRPATTGWCTAPPTSCATLRTTPSATRRPSLPSPGCRPSRCRCDAAGGEGGGVIGRQYAAGEAVEAPTGSNWIALHPAHSWARRRLWRR